MVHILLLLYIFYSGVSFFEKEILQQSFHFTNGYPKKLVGFNILLDCDNDRIIDIYKVLYLEGKDSKISIYNFKITTFLL